MVPSLLPGAAWAVIRNFAPFAGVCPPIRYFRESGGIVSFCSAFGEYGAYIVSLQQNRRKSPLTVTITAPTMSQATGSGLTYSHIGWFSLTG